jgi:hypothetical protein
MFSALTPNAAAFLAGIFGILLIASGIVFALKRAHPDKDYTNSPRG